MSSRRFLRGALAKARHADGECAAVAQVHLRDARSGARFGARFDALYLPPPSRPEKPLTVKTLIVPTSEYADGRNVILTTGRSLYTIALRHLVEQRAEWSWAAFQIVGKKPMDL